MKKLRMVLLAGLLIAALCAPAHAWEFSMTGNFQWTYEYFDQAGQNGFFGPQNVTTAGLAATGTNWFYPNFWAGARLLSGTQYGMLGELNSVVIWSRMVMNPEIRVNPAIRLRGQYLDRRVPELEWWSARRDRSAGCRRNHFWESPWVRY